MKLLFVTSLTALLLLSGCRSPEDVAQDIEAVEKTLPPGCHFQETFYNGETVYLVFCDGQKTVSVNRYWRTQNGKVSSSHHRMTVIVG